MATEFECTSWAMALTALDVIAANIQGKQRAAVLAVRVWVQKHAPKGLSEETLKKLEDVFNRETEGQRKGREWNRRGSRKIGGKVRYTEPEDGAEWTCVWNAKAACWEPHYPPPFVCGLGSDRFVDGDFSIPHKGLKS